MYYIQKCSDSFNSSMELPLVKPHTRDQSNKDLINNAVNWVTELSVSSKVQWFLSLHNLNIKRRGTKFQISDECLPTQFLQPNKRSMTFSGNTHRIPKDLKQNSTNHKQLMLLEQNVSSLSWHWRFYFYFLNWC